MKKKKIDILDLLPPEAVQRVDAIGYDFLKANGYDTEGAIQSTQKRKEIRQALKKNGDVLTYTGMISEEKQAILVWFELHRRGKKIATSQGVKFLMRKGENDGEGQADQS